MFAVRMILGKANDVVKECRWQKDGHVCARFRSDYTANGKYAKNVGEVMTWIIVVFRVIMSFHIIEECIESFVLVHHCLCFKV